MAKKKYRELEQRIIKIFKSEGKFQFKNETYTVENVDKPTTSKGECKTDVYISGRTVDDKEIELKISVKTRSSNEFQENKATAIKMESYFGQSWQDIIIKASKSLSDKFEKQTLIYVNGKHPTKPNSITLGWKLEIASKERNLSVPIPLTDKEIRDYVYKGTNLPQDKKDAYVCNKVIENSGVADYLLKTEIAEINSTSDVINQLELIDSLSTPKCYIIFTANNYRTKEDKADGKRYLAVYINWKCIDKQLVPEYIYDSPLKYNGEENVKPILLKALNQLGKSHPCDFDLLSDIKNKDIVSDKDLVKS